MGLDERRLALENLGEWNLRTHQRLPTRSIHNAHGKRREPELGSIQTKADGKLGLPRRARAFHLIIEGGSGE